MEHPKTPFDFLIDILLWIPCQLCLLGGHDIRDALTNMCNLSEEARDTIEKETRGLLQKLHDWRWHFDQLNFVSSPPDIRGCQYGGEPADEIPSALYDSRDTLAVTSIAIYSTACIVLHSVLLRLADFRTAYHPFDRDRTRPALSIINHVAFEFHLRSGCLSAFRVSIYRGYSKNKFSCQDCLVAWYQR